MAFSWREPHTMALPSACNERAPLGHHEVAQDFAPEVLMVNLDSPLLPSGAQLVEEQCGMIGCEADEPMLCNDGTEAAYQTLRVIACNSFDPCSSSVGARSFTGRLTHGLTHHRPEVIDGAAENLTGSVPTVQSARDKPEVRHEFRPV